MRSPSWSGCEFSIFSPFTKVPVALPASESRSAPLSKLIREWNDSTLPSRIWTSASRLEPTMISRPVNWSG